MFEKFGEFNSADEINELAKNLLKEGDKESIYALAKENGIPKDYADMMVDGEFPMLCDATMAANGKIDVEAQDLKPKGIMVDWCDYIRAVCMEDGEMAENVRKKGKSLKDLLGLDGKQLHALKMVNGNTYAIRALRYAKDHGEKLPVKTLRTITLLDINVEHINLKRTGMTLCRMVNYMTRQAAELNKTFQETVRLYSDYLDMAWTLGADLKDEIICHTSRLQEMHDRYTREKNANIDKYNAQNADKKFTKISEKYEENTEHFKYSKAGLTILVPTCASDIQFEGKRQHHCVGASDRYLIRMNEGESFILFLRKEEAKEEPYYTLEVEYDGKIRQSYGAYDRKPDWDKVEPVLIGFTRAIGKRTQRERQMAAG